MMDKETLHELVHAILYRLETEFDEWCTHLMQVRNRRLKLDAKYPTLLKDGVLATDKQCSRCLRRLQRLQKMLRKRCRILRRHRLHRYVPNCPTPCSLLHSLLTSERSELGNQTLSWKATLALHEAEHFYAHIHDHCEMGEQFMMDKLTELIGVVEICHDALTSSQYNDYRRLVDEKLEGSAIVEQLFHQGRLEEEYFDWRERLKEIDCEIREVDEDKFLEKLEGNMLFFQSAMSDLGFDMPRQTVIENYFHIESSTIDGDSTMDEDEE